jgi:chorismate mutase
MSIAQIRQKLDRIDEKLVELLNARAQLSLQILQEKQKSGLPIYNPQREQQVLHHVAGQNKGLLSPEQLESIFKLIIETCRTIQQQQKGIENGNCDEE